MYKFSQLIDFPTHFEDSCSDSLLDHVYSNINTDRLISVVGVDTHISDHHAQRVVVSTSRDINPGPHHITKRSYSTSNKTTFEGALAAVDWDKTVQTCDDCDSLAERFVSTLVNRHDLCFPLRKQPKTLNKSWVDTEVLNFKYLLFDVLELGHRYPSNEVIVSIENNLSSRYNSLLRVKRTDYYSNVLKDSSNKAKCMWNIINTEIGRNNRDRVDQLDRIRAHDGKPYASKNDTLEALNREFATAANKCGAPTADTSRAVRVLEVGTPASNTSLRLTPFTQFELHTIVNKHIASKNSTDIYGLSTNLLKIIVQSTACALCNLFNKCMRWGVYPKALKKVKIVPLYKGKGKRSEISSYRPISLVPALSKILEVGLNKRILSFISGNNMLSERQYAYRPGHSTTDLAREVVWRVLGAREAGKQVALLCCDLSRAFDTADHHLIALKLEHYGFRGPTLALLSSFMTERIQVVTGDRGHTVSSEIRNFIGVPQGSCLSNTLFSLLLNDLPSVITGADIFMYADDVAAVITAPNKIQLEVNLNSVVEQLERWFKSNGLALNREKTCFMTFNLNGSAPPPCRVVAGSVALKQVVTTKLLGFYIDSALVWDTHIDETCSRLGSACYALGRLSKTATRGVVRSCYFATIHSKLSYGVELWGQAAEVQRAFVMQKRAIRAIAGIPVGETCRGAFKELDILTLPGELILQIALFTRENLDFVFKRRGVNESRMMRSNKFKDRLVSPTHKLVKSKKSVYIIGPAVYNRLPDNVRNAPSQPSFKGRLKKWLIDHTFYTFNEFLQLPLS